MEKKDIDTEFFKKFDDAKKMFSTLFRQAKKEIILQDSEDFMESMSERIMEDYGLTEDDAEKYAELMYQIWEDNCGCSITSFDQEISSLRKKIFG